MLAQRPADGYPLPLSRDCCLLALSLTLAALLLLLPPCRQRTAAWPSGWPLGQTSDSGITHAVVISGNPLCMEIAEDDSIVWQYRGEGAGTSRPGSRDASKLPNGNYLVTLGDKVVEVAPGETEAVWTYELDTASGNTEFMGAQRLADGSTVVTECGENPRIVEVAADGKTIIAEIPIQPETDNAHQQSRMGKKLADGNYLVPHRVACVKEYDSTGAVVHEFRTDIPELEGTAGLTAYGTGPTNGLATTDDAQARSSFFAERLPDGSTVITCASGNRMCVFDKDRKLAWHVSNHHSLISGDVSERLLVFSGDQR